MQPYSGRHRTPSRVRRRSVFAASGVLALGVGLAGANASKAESPAVSAAALSAEQPVAAQPAPAKPAPPKAAPVTQARNTSAMRPSTRTSVPGLSGVAAATGLAASGGKAATAAYGFSSPVKSLRVSSQFGPRWGRIHQGVDFAGPIGSPIRSVGLGEVTFAGTQSGYGNIVIVMLHDGTETRYAHLDSIGVRVGDTVARGELIGTLGNTGRSTGPHLHFEVRPDGGAAVDPLPWLAERGARN